MDSLSPNLFVRDIRGTLEFYKRLGFELVLSVPGEDENSDLIWAMASCGNVRIMFQTYQSLGNSFPQISRQDGGSLLFYIRLKNIRNYYDSIRDRVPILHGLQKTFYGATEFSVVDNNNFVLTFSEQEDD